MGLKDSTKNNGLKREVQRKNELEGQYREQWV